VIEIESKIESIVVIETVVVVEIESIVIEIVMMKTVIEFMIQTGIEVVG